MQIAEYATGGALVALLSPRISLLVAAALYVLAAAVVRLGLTGRPPRATGRPSVSATWRANALLWSSAPRRQVYLALWIPNGLVVGCESLYVSYAPDSAGTLFAFAALGMLAGDVLVGRLVPPRLRPRLGFPLLLVLAVPYVPFLLHPPLPLAAAAVTLASVGFGASLVQQERLVALTPDALTGHALGLHSAGMLTMQGVAAALAGSVAQLTSPAGAMTAMATLSAGVTLALMTAGRRERRATAPVPGRRASEEGPREVTKGVTPPPALSSGAPPSISRSAMSSAHLLQRLSSATPGTSRPWAVNALSSSQSGPVSRAWRSV
ncbi:hypothetical protein SVIOM74S_07151 [Streptomyces violarus]